MTRVRPATDAAIAEAADILRRGGLVAMPTETVYGLAANALDADAVAGVFRAKGRPATNPVIVHVADSADIAPLVANWSETARKLADRFWPGPLTLVFERDSRIPDIVTAGGPTVAVRVPAHPAARALIAACGFPLAAPSANRSNCLSPTRAEHVLRSLAGRIDLILDAGECPGGLESTVVDATTQPPTLLRPGLISRTDLQDVVGEIRLGHSSAPTVRRSPGQLRKHYAPNAPVVFTRNEELGPSLHAGHRIGWLSFGPATSPPPPNVTTIEMPTSAEDYSARLYAVLHDFDQQPLDRILITLPPEDDPWLAVHDRLARMAESEE